MCMKSQGTRRALLPWGPKGDRDPEPKPEPPRLNFFSRTSPLVCVRRPGRIGVRPGGSWCSWCVLRVLWLAVAMAGCCLLRTVSLTASDLQRVVWASPGTAPK